MGTQAAELAHERSFKLGKVTIEPSLRLVRKDDGATLKVEPRVMQVLVALASANGALLTRSDLRDLCWAGRMTSDDAIDRVIAQLRRLASSVGGDSFSVETVPKVGYRLVELPIGQQALPEDQQTFSRRTMVGGAVGTLAVAAAGIEIYEHGGGAKRRAVDVPLTIAVLPFTTEVPQPQLEAFAAELSDEVRSDVSRVVDIRVIAETSSRKVADAGLTAQQIGNSLATDYLVEGRVGSANGQLVTDVALVEATSGSQVWNAQESAPFADPTSLRSAIAGDVIQHLAGIIPISSQHLPPVHRPDPEAYVMVQQANRLLDDVRTNEMRGKRSVALGRGAKAEQLAERALSIDPNYSGALAVLAIITRNGWTPALAAQNLTTKQRIQASIALVRRALLADPRDPAALTQLGDYYRRFEFRWTEAENLFRRALSVDPSFVDAHWSYAYELGTLGRAVEGIDHALSVFELDPRNPFHRVALPRLLYVAGARNAAMRLYDAELQEQPDNLFLLRELYFMFLTESNGPALQALSAHVSNRPKTPELSALSSRIDAGRLALRGRPEPLRALTDAEVVAFDRESAASNATPQGRARDDLPFIFAIEYAWAGLPEKSINMLDRALSAKSLYWPTTLPFGATPFPRQVRESPRYQALWNRDPGLVQLIRSRRLAISERQMAGFAPDGRKVIAALPAALVRRVHAAVAAQR